MVEQSCYEQAAPTSAELKRCGGLVAEKSKSPSIAREARLAETLHKLHHGEG